MVHVRTINLTSRDLNNEYEIAKNYSLSSFKRVVKSSADCFLDGKLVFCFRKCRFKHTYYFELLQSTLVDRLLNSDHRKMAGGTPGQRIPVSSGILGYYDKLTPQMKSALGGVNQAGRETAFVKHYPDRWNRLIPFFQEINDEYKHTCPVEYGRQESAVRKVHKKLRIPHTVFTTITINKNWRTSTHTDKGDFVDGMSCLVILGKDFRGGFVGFPRLGVVVEAKHGDVIFMNSHEPHCNTVLDIDVKGKGSGIRYSVVCYLRTDLQKFHREKRIANDTFFIE